MSSEIIVSVSQKEIDYKIAIIGGGPSGIATAIQLKRYNIKAILFEKNELCGLLRNAYKIENYPGFPNGISGIELHDIFRKHCLSASITPVFEKVISVDYNEKDERFVIESERAKYIAEIVVVASGTRQKKIDYFEKIDEKLKNRVFYEILHLLNSQDKDIAIIGSGDIAFDYALNLSRKNKIYIINRSNVIRALPILQERIKNNQNIEYLENSIVEDIDESNDRLRLTVMNKKDKIYLTVDYVVCAIGREAQKDFYSSKLIKIEDILISKGLLYLVGDVKNDIYRQISISVGDGIYTGMKIYNKLKEYENNL